MIWNVHRRRPRGREKPGICPHRKSSFVGAAALFLTFYTALILGSSCVHADLNPTTPRQVSWHVAVDTDDNHAEEPLCRSVHEHVLLAVAVADHPEVVSASLIVLSVTQDKPGLNDAKSAAFRPPDGGFPYPHRSFQLNTVLRI
jgi:hypothetical protein